MYSIILLLLCILMTSESKSNEMLDNAILIVLLFGIGNIINNKLISLFQFHNIKN